jgi:DNA-binding winged helix-turn-helix (wHTH) protein
MHHRAPLAEREACRLGEFEIDLATSRLSYRGQSIHLTKRTFDVLALLVRHAGHTVDKDQLIREVWGGVCVEENNLARHISVIRKIFHSFEPDREYVLTVPSRGYQFVIPQVEAEPPATPLPTASASRSWTSGANDGPCRIVDPGRHIAGCAPARKTAHPSAHGIGCTWRALAASSDIGRGIGR